MEGTYFSRSVMPLNSTYYVTSTKMTTLAKAVTVKKTMKATAADQDE